MPQQPSPTAAKRRISPVRLRPNSTVSSSELLEPSAGTLAVTGALATVTPETMIEVPLRARPALKIDVRPDDPDDSVFVMLPLTTPVADAVFGVVTSKVTARSRRANEAMRIHDTGTPSIAAMASRKMAWMIAVNSAGVMPAKVVDVVTRTRGTVGAGVGATVGVEVGKLVGVCVGAAVGEVGVAVGAAVGEVGASVGNAVGDAVGGGLVGEAVGVLGGTGG